MADLDLGVEWLAALDAIDKIPRVRGVSSTFLVEQHQFTLGHAQPSVVAGVDQAFSSEIQYATQPSLDSRKVER